MKVIMIPSFDLIIAYAVIVDVTISETNTHGRAFWKKCFKNDDEVLEVSENTS